MHGDGERSNKNKHVCIHDLIIGISLLIELQRTIRPMHAWRDNTEFVAHWGKESGSHRSIFRTDRGEQD
jgi:hypothetical protein